MSRRNTPVVITSLGQGGSRSPWPRRPRVGLGAAVATGLAVLFIYAAVSLVFHLLVAAVLWLPAIVLAGYAVGYAGRKGIHGAPRLAIGIVVLLVVRAALHAL